MLYSFQSLEQHNFISILKRKVYRLLWPITIVVALQLLFPRAQFVKDNFHFYFFLATEALQLFSITRDSINKIIIDTNKKILQISYYNFHQGQMKAMYPFAEIKLDISESRKNEVREINFYIKKKADYTLQKDKDNFSQQDLESLKELLYAITSPKSI